ncbi:MAG: TRAP transporter TatT component family protein [Desulfotalea sp.]
MKKISLLILLAPLLLTSCAKLITDKVVAPAVANIQQQTDIQLVCDGAPSYLLMVDSMLASNPEDESMLSLASQAYIGYTGALAACEAPNTKISINGKKARLYGSRLLEEMVHIQTEPDKLVENLAKMRKSDVPELFWGSFGILTWIQLESGSPAAMADLTIVAKTMERVLALDENFQGGAPHLFFGGYYAARPVYIGGDPEKARIHFEKALKNGDRKFLLTHVTYAKTIARLTFDKELHDSLLKEVINFPIDSAPQYALSNRIAQKQAKELLEEEYFD